jgi:opacity protein-like surface antigen
MRKLLLLCLCAILLGTAAPALANSPSQGAYGGTGNNQLSQVQSNTSDTTASSSSTLPFTGLNVPVVAAIAAGLVGAGVALRIRTRTDS